MSKNVSDVEYLKILDEAYEEAWEVANSEDGWKEEHKGSFLSYGYRNKINFHGANCLLVSLRVFYPRDTKIYEIVDAIIKLNFR
jgi:hypothetical protein